MGTWFYDVPRPIYLVKHALARFDLRQNTYSYYTEKMVGPHNEDVSSSNSSCDDQDDKSEKLKTEGRGEEDNVGEGGKDETSATIYNEAVKKTRAKCGGADNPVNQDDSVPSYEGHLPTVGQLGNQLGRMAVKDKLDNDDGGETNSANMEEDVRTAIKQRRGAPPDFQMIGECKNKH